MLLISHYNTVIPWRYPGTAMVQFQTMAMKGLSQENEAYEIFGFLVHIKGAFELHGCLLSVQ